MCLVFLSVGDLLASQADHQHMREGLAENSLSYFQPILCLVFLSVGDLLASQPDHQHMRKGLAENSLSCF